MTGGGRPDAIVVGAGPNGLAAAITLAGQGRSVAVLEAAPTIGGGCRTEELTLPGFRHDVCSAIHPLAVGSPFLAGLPLAELGVELVQPDIPLTHPLDGGRAAALFRSIDETALGLGADGPAWRRLFGPVAESWPDLAPAVLGPVLRVPRHPVAMAGFGVRALAPATWLARLFRTEDARGLLAGIAGHGFLPLGAPLSGSFAVLLGALAHAVGWPLVAGGSQRLVDGLAAHLRSLGGTIETDHRVERLADLPPGGAVVADVTPRQLAHLADDRLTAAGRRQLEGFRYGPGVCKVDYALAEPVPWAAHAARRAGTLHLGGTFEEIAAAEADVAAGRHPERPYVLVAQQSLFDDARAPAEQHTLWAYAHVPHGSDRDVSAAITAQIERFAPGFRDIVLAEHVRTATAYEAYNASVVGGDISAGSHAGTQLVARPWPALDPYATPVDGVFLCSASTPPGGGVHGMCGFHAAQSALRWLDRRR